jgi:hypothetical protein
MVRFLVEAQTDVKPLATLVLPQQKRTHSPKARAAPRGIDGCNIQMTVLWNADGQRSGVVHDDSQYGRWPM